MAIKNRALELKGYEESRTTAHTYTHTHNMREIAHNFKFHL